jgi:hypothetical protein
MDSNMASAAFPAPSGMGRHRLVWVPPFQNQGRGCLSFTQKGAIQHALAGRPMPINWRIGVGDLDWGKEQDHPDFTGKYVACKLELGEPIVASDTRDEPVIALADGKISYILKSGTQSSHLQDLNVGAHLDLFGATGAPVATNARVIAILCTNSCSAVLELTPAESQQLRSENAATLTFLARK